MNEQQIRNTLSLLEPQKQKALAVLDCVGSLQEQLKMLRAPKNPSNPPQKPKKKKK